MTIPTCPKSIARHGAFAAVAIAIVLTWCSPAFGDEADRDFEASAATVLATRCVECHNAVEPTSGLDLSTAAGAIRGGDAGPAIDAGKPEESLLIDRVVAGEMPPESRGQSQKLPDAEIEILRKWIAAGAKWPAGRTLGLYEKTTTVRGGLDWWSLQPIRRPPVPAARQAERASNPIDAFLLARLDVAEMTFAPQADRPALLRRLSFDLVGMPPGADDIAAFESDPSPDAWHRAVDRLLASPHYGERWGRHWLDVVRFAETCGYERDQLKPGIWRYRDWVVRALNADMPYDRFVTLQLAGDEVPDRDVSTVVATGMLRAGTWNDEPNDPADYLYERLEDLVHTTSSAFLGLTVKCARCHNHKFDPIPQADYYRLAGAFWPGYLGQENLGGPNAAQLGCDAFGWTDRGPTADPLRLLEKGDRHRPGKEVTPGFLTAIPTLDRPLAAPPAGSRTTHRRLQLARWLVDGQHPLTARVMVNRLWLHHFGEGIVRTADNFGFKGDRPTHPELLDWLAAEFATPGFAAESDAQWSTKHIHRLMLASRAYRQASVHPRHAAYATRDAQNLLWWRANRRRLDAEALRDALLAASGRLNPRMGGPSFFPSMSGEALEGLSRKGEAWQASPPHEQTRRSIYMMTKRSRLLPLMTVFDFPDTTLPCSRRDATSVAPQALAMLNNEFVHDQSAALAERVVRAAGNDRARRIDAAWMLALGRLPKPRESELAAIHVAAQEDYFRTRLAEPTSRDPGQLALASLCHVLLNSNEFLFVD